MSDYTNINYANLTINHRNPIKRMLQSHRLDHGLLELQRLGNDFQGQVLDFGSGDGELCRRLNATSQPAEIVCYEPAENLREQAEKNLAGIKNVRIIGDVSAYPDKSFDFIFCLEVFEHLPEKETLQALTDIHRLAKEDATIVIGVPNELFLAALLKGAFRLKQRYGSEDARFGNIFRAFLGFPPRNRPVIQFGDMPYILRHIGFNHRQFKKTLSRFFHIRKLYGSPNLRLPIFANFEVYFVCQAREVIK